MSDSPAPAKPRARRLKAVGVAFVPVPLARKRRDGWSPDKQQSFLVALHATGVVATAARAAGMSGRSAYRLRDRPGAASFAAAWDRLLREARERALDMAMEAALTDGFVPRTYRGQPTGRVVVASNERMIIAALRASAVAGWCPNGASSVAILDQFLSGKGHE